MPQTRPCYQHFLLGLQQWPPPGLPVFCLTISNSASMQLPRCLQFIEPLYSLGLLANLGFWLLKIVLIETSVCIAFGMRLLDNRVSICSALEDTALKFSKVDKWLLPQLYQYFVISIFFHFTHSGGHMVSSNYSFKLHSLFD